MEKRMKAFRWIAIHFPELFAGIALITAIFVACFTVVSRYLFRYAYGGADEIECICFTWAVFLGSAAVYRNKGHYGIDLIVSFFNEKAQKVLKLIAQILILIIMVVLAALSLKLTLSVKGKIWPFLEISYIVSDLSLVIGFTLMSIYAAIFLVQDVKALMNSNNGGGKEA